PSGWRGSGDDDADRLDGRRGQGGGGAGRGENGRSAPAASADAEGLDGAGDGLLGAAQADRRRPAAGRTARRRRTGHAGARIQNGEGAGVLAPRLVAAVVGPVRAGDARCGRVRVREGGLLVSFYATITGSAHYPTKEAIDVALTRLRKHGWMNDQNDFVDERNRPLVPDRAPATVEGLTLHVPWTLYRNLASYLDEILAGSKHKIAWTSTDGTYAAGVLIDGNETEFDLEEWAAEHVGPPDEGEEDGHYWAEVEFEFINWAMREWEFDKLSSDGA